MSVFVGSARHPQMVLLGRSLRCGVMPVEHPQPDFRNMSLQHGIVLVELYRSGSAPRCFTELVRATGRNAGTLSHILTRLESNGFVRRWQENACGVQWSRTFFALTNADAPAVREAVREAVRLFGVRLGDLEGLPVVESSGSEADVARELGILLGLVQDQSGLSGTAIAALVGHRQAWWSRHLRGIVRDPDVHTLRVIMRALSAPDDTVVRVVGLAETLNRLWAERAGSRAMNDKQSGPPDETVLSRNAKDATVKEVAAWLGVSVASVRKYRAEPHSPKPDYYQGNRPRWLRTRVSDWRTWHVTYGPGRIGRMADELRRKYEAGATVRELAEEYGLGFGTVQRQLHKADAQIRGGGDAARS